MDFRAYFLERFGYQFDKPSPMTLVTKHLELVLGAMADFIDLKLGGKL